MSIHRQCWGHWIILKVKQSCKVEHPEYTYNNWMVVLKEFQQLSRLFKRRYKGWKQEPLSRLSCLHRFPFHLLPLLTWFRLNRYLVRLRKKELVKRRKRNRLKLMSWLGIVQKFSPNNKQILKIKYQNELNEIYFMSDLFSN